MIVPLYIVDENSAKYGDSNLLEMFHFSPVGKYMPKCTKVRALLTLWSFDPPRKRLLSLEKCLKVSFRRKLKILKVWQKLWVPIFLQNLRFTNTCDFSKGLKTPI